MAIGQIFYLPFICSQCSKGISVKLAFIVDSLGISRLKGGGGSAVIFYLTIVGDFNPVSLLPY